MNFWRHKGSIKLLSEKIIADSQRSFMRFLKQQEKKQQEKKTPEEDQETENGRRRSSFLEDAER
jgi:hypothetical protein